MGLEVIEPKRECQIMGFRILFLAFNLIALTLSTSGWAQSYENQGRYLSAPAKKLKRSFTTIIFSSLAGGALGLSTLSFYGRPQEHTVNVTTGILLGLVGGLGYVVYQTTQDNLSPQYQSFDPNQSPGRDFRIASQTPITFSFHWDFE